MPGTWQTLVFMHFIFTERERLEWFLPRELLVHAPAKPAEISRKVPWSTLCIR